MERACAERLADMDEAVGAGEKDGASACPEARRDDGDEDEARGVNEAGCGLASRTV